VSVREEQERELLEARNRAKESHMRNSQEQLSQSQADSSQGLGEEDSGDKLSGLTPNPPDLMKWLENDEFYVKENGRVYDVNGNMVKYYRQFPDKSYVEYGGAYYNKDGTLFMDPESEETPMADSDDMLSQASQYSRNRSTDATDKGSDTNSDSTGAVYSPQRGYRPS